MFCGDLEVFCYPHLNNLENMFTNKHHIQYLSRKNLKAVAIRFFQSRETVEGFSLGHFSPKNIRIKCIVQ